MFPRIILTCLFTFDALLSAPLRIQAPGAQSAANDDAISGPSQRDENYLGTENSIGESAVLPSPSTAAPTRPIDELRGIDWTSLARSSGLFLATVQTFRYATETDTRANGVGINSGYLKAVGNLHGWNDSDPYYVNYVAHPMEGAIWPHLSVERPAL